MATGGENDWLNEVLMAYSKDQRDIIIDFLDEMSRTEWRYHAPDLAFEAARLLREKF